MKKNFVLLMCLLAAFSLLVLTSCGDDDDDDGGGSGSAPSKNACIITTSDGEELLLTGVKSGTSFDWAFNYDITGRPTYAEDEETSYYFGYDPYEVTSSDYDDIKLSFNSSGYITKATCSYSYTGSSYSYSYTGTATFTYDGSGHLTKVSGSGTESGEEDGEKYTGTETENSTLTWSGGNLIKSSTDYVYKEGSEKFTEVDEYEYEYGNTENEYKQLTCALIDEAFLEACELCYDFGFIGYFGVGTANFPASVENTYSNSDGYSGNYTTSYTYTKNSNGTIKTEKIDNGSKYSPTYTYSYSTLSSDETRSVVPNKETGVSKIRPSLRERALARRARVQTAE